MNKSPLQNGYFIGHQQVNEQLIRERDICKEISNLIQNQGEMIDTQVLPNTEKALHSARKAVTHLKRCVNR